MAGAKQRNAGVRRTGRREAGTLLLRAGTECEKINGAAYGAQMRLGLSGLCVDTGLDPAPA
jgi:hypothetical protein